MNKANSIEEKTTEEITAKEITREEPTEEKADEKRYFVYILECADHTLYTGYTTDLERRLRTHNAGKGAKYTKTRRPVRLVYYEDFPEKGQALSREAAIKNLTRAQKLALIEESEPYTDS